MDSFDYTTYLSPFTTRYGSGQMRHIWSEVYKRTLWRRVWVALAKAQHQAGLVSKKELDDIIAHQENIDIPRAKAIEKEIYHELMAEIRTYSEQCKVGGGKIHLGATSTDILDNATNIQLHESLQLVEKKLKELLAALLQKIRKNQDVVCMAYTHLQPAEPTTLAYRLSFYAQDLLMDLELLQKIKPLLKGKGIKGAVGTSASYDTLLQGTSVSAEILEKHVLEELGVSAVAVSTQTYPRKIDLLVVQLLSQIAASLHKFAFDYRLMQQPSIGEWMEKRDSKRVGSSAMPFKRNPDKAEKVCGLCRYISSLISVAWSNPALSALERTLDDTSSQRIFLPESFLAIDECLVTATKLLENLVVNTDAVEKNLATYGQFAGIEPLLMALAKKSANRQDMHELLKQCSMKVWEAKDNGKELSLLNVLQQEPSLTQYLSSQEISKALDPTSHIGLATKRAQQMVKTLEKVLNTHRD